jgi:hypothetical protein
MAQSAPRYDPRIVRAIHRLDDRATPIAQTCRRVGEFAWSLGLTRPSYVHVRRIVHAERARREALRTIIDDVVEDVLRHRPVDAYEIAERLREVPPRTGG